MATNFFTASINLRPNKVENKTAFTHWINEGKLEVAYVTPQERDNVMFLYTDGNSIDHFCVWNNNKPFSKWHYIGTKGDEFNI